MLNSLKSVILASSPVQSYPCLFFSAAPYHLKSLRLREAKWPHIVRKKRLSFVVLCPLIGTSTCMSLDLYHSGLKQHKKKLHHPSQRARRNEFFSKEYRWKKYGRATFDQRCASPSNLRERHEKEDEEEREKRDEALELWR
ncbi:hypothetical protein MRB53_013840 [Persea americana]|uniref:Uncharacterized protein n=1 Tax=Persea americana TaxID=3435 RepID=A0ACC2K9M4_PERAE|nr:hypothetical protein MRB53_013840 [Persea americana]